VYGTDFPYRPAAEQSKGIDFAEDDRKRVKRSIALGRAKPRCLLFGDDTALPAIAAVLELPAPRLAANMLNL
jgi:NADPH-dependent ferric siderophore reductase